MLNPARIVLTGRFATQDVRDGIEEHLETVEVLGRIFGGAPQIDALEGENSAYVAVLGAALAVLREHVHRRLDSLFRVEKKVIQSRFNGLTQPMRTCPWS